MRALLLVSVGALALTGCAEHIDLRAPPATAPVQTRVAAYNALRGLSYHETTVTTFGTIGSATAHYTDYLQLANGGRVYYPEDLLPIVADDSPSATAAHASESKRETARILTLSSILSVAAGAALVIVPLTQTSSSGHVNGTPIIFGLSLALVGGLGFGIASHFFRESSQDEAATAYETYDPSLLKRLNLCAQGDALANCER